MLSPMDYSSQVNHQVLWVRQRMQLQCAATTCSVGFAEAFGRGRVKRDTRMIILYPVCP